MAERNPNRPQSIEPGFIADFVRELAVEGRVGVFNVSDTIAPVYLLGQREAFRVEVAGVNYAPGQWFSAGLLTNPAAATMIADTTALPAGTYDAMIWIGMGAANMKFVFEHRDGANAATINQQHIWLLAETQYQTKIALDLEVNERLRIWNATAPGAGVELMGSLLVKAR